MLLVWVMTQSRFDLLPAKSGFFSRHERVIFWLVAAGLLALTAYLHFWKIGTVPRGFHIDESSYGYNAWCIAQTGADEYGRTLPVFVRGFGDYVDATIIYPLVPFVKYFGLTRSATRVPKAVFLILASVALAFLVQQYCRNKWLSICTSFCFSILPWTFVASRTFGQMPMLFGIATGCLLLLRAVEGQSYRNAIAAGAAWAFTMYTYHIGRPMTVLLLACFSVAYFHVLKTRWNVVRAFLLTWVVMLFPLVVSIARTPEILTNRFQTVTISQDHPALGEAISRVASRYAEYFSPQFLFFKGDPHIHDHTGFGGELFRFLIPMIIAGVYCLFRYSRSQPGCRFLGLALLAYPTAAALTEERMHTGRSLHGSIFWALTAAVGAHYLWQKKGLGRNLLVLSCGLGILEMGLYMRDYFGAYQLRSRGAYTAAYTEALEDCFRTVGTNETLYISESTYSLWKLKLSADFKPFMYVDVLFFGKIDPRYYQQHGIPKDRVCLYDGTISKPGLLLRCNLRYVEPTFEWRAESSLSNTWIGGDRMPHPIFFDVNREPIPDGAELLKIIPAGSGFRYEIYRVK